MDIHWQSKMGNRDKHFIQQQRLQPGESKIVFRYECREEDSAFELKNHTQNAYDGIVAK